MAGAGFHSIAKLRAHIHNAVLADRGLSHADCYRENCHTAARIAIVRGPNLRAECQRPEPPAGFVLGLRADVGNPRNIGKLIAKEIVLWWHSVELECGG
jgi:hypothetical protein